MDQKFCDLVPCFFDEVFLLKHVGYNAAYWNLHERRIEFRSGGWWVNESVALRFFHFSGVDPENDKELSKHQNRFELATLGDLHELLIKYCASLRHKKDSRKEALSQARYHYGRLVDGTTITDEMRHVYRAVQPSGPRAYTEAFSPDLGPYLLAEPDLAVSGVIVPQLMYHIWSRRKDLQLVFPLGGAAGLESFTRWFQESVTREYKIPGRVVEAIIEAIRARTGAQDAERPAIVAADAPKERTTGTNGSRRGASATTRRGSTTTATSGLLQASERRRRSSPKRSNSAGCR